jgi:hypothetical protein
VLKGSLLFMADLAREIRLPLTCDFLRVSSYEGMKSTGVVRFDFDLTQPIKDKHVLVVEDIIDTGLTMTFLLETLQVLPPGTDGRPGGLEAGPVPHPPGERVLPRSERRHQAGLLEDGADSPAHRPQLSPGQAGDVASFEPEATRGGAEGGVEHPEEGGLPRPGGAQHRDPLAGLDPEAHLDQRLDRARASGEAATDVFEGEDHFSKPSRIAASRSGA